MARKRRPLFLRSSLASLLLLGCSSSGGAPDAAPDVALVYRCDLLPQVGLCHEPDGGPIDCPTAMPYCMNLENGNAPVCATSIGWCALDTEVILACGVEAECGTGPCKNGDPCTDLHAHPGTCQCN